MNKIKLGLVLIISIILYFNLALSSNNLFILDCKGDSTIATYKDHSFFNGICPYCAKEGKKSIVRDLGCSRTLMAPSSYYDEEGNYHYKDHNITTCYFGCSNDHNFSTKSGKLIIKEAPKKKER